MQLAAQCRLIFETSAEVPAIFMLRPRSGYGQWVMKEEYILDPHLPMVEYTDGFGNLCQRALIPQGRFVLEAKCAVDTADTIDVDPGAPFTPLQDVPDLYLQFLLPSRYCQSDLLWDLAAEVTQACAPGYDQVDAIRAWIRKEITYQYGTSNSNTSALDTARDRVGVCRDLSHLGIALCRALNIPARMVVGYLHELKPMDLHAWFEAYINGRWYVFDATQPAPRGNRITVAYGRDAADVALTTQFGPMHLIDMQVDVWPADESEVPEKTTGDSC